MRIAKTDRLPHFLQIQHRYPEPGIFPENVTVARFCLFHRQVVRRDCQNFNPDVEIWMATGNNGG